MRLHNLFEKMSIIKDALADENEEALRKERDERIAAIRAVTAENQSATARLERQIAITNKDIADMKLGMLRDLRDYPTKKDIEVMVVDRLNKMEAKMERSFPPRPSRS